MSFSFFRAIENQCYVIAAAQIGRHNLKRTSFGHSVIIDPWGTVLAACSDRVNGFIIQKIKNYSFFFLYSKRVNESNMYYKTGDLMPFHKILLYSWFAFRKGLQSLRLTILGLHKSGWACQLWITNVRIFSGPFQRANMWSEELAMEESGNLDK